MHYLNPILGHHRSLTEVLVGQSRFTAAESFSSSRSSSSNAASPAQQSNDDASRSNDDASSRSSGPAMAYRIQLACRSADPVADSFKLAREELPSHWVPTIRSQFSRATSTAFGLRTDAPRHANLHPHLRHLSPDKKVSEHHLLPRLHFKNPWQESFRKPSIRTALHGGLKWGLPDSYKEGAEKGKGQGQASALKPSRKAHRQQREAEEEVARWGEEWDKIEVLKPQWGWPAAGLMEEVHQLREEELKAHPLQQQGQEKKTSKRGDEADYKAKEVPLREWKDPKDHTRVAARVTWLGHASTLIQLPPLSTDHAAADGTEDVSARSINVLFDPIFSERCSPSQAAGPQRFTPAPCSVEELPPIDVVVISHSHYDHLDYHTMKRLRQLRGDRIHAFVPLMVKDKLAGPGGFGWRPEQVSELDWWDQAVLTLPSSSKAGGGELKFICTPAQHGSGRGAGDKDTSLWASWVMEWKAPASCSESGLRFCAFFAGDTGLKYHHDNPHKRHKYPACPAFGEIAQRYGPFDLLLLPISVGSSLSWFRSWDPFPRAISPFPRVSSTLTSSIHMDAHDAVECHQIFQRERDAQGERKRAMVSFAVHYATFVRNHEQTRGDIRELAKACSARGVPFCRIRDEAALLKTGEEELEVKQEQQQLADADRERDVFIVADQGRTVWLPIHPAPSSSSPAQEESC